MKIICVVALLGMTGCANTPSPHEQLIAMIGVTYGAAMFISDDKTACDLLRDADDEAKDVNFPHKAVEELEGMKKLRVTCGISLTEN